MINSIDIMFILKELKEERKVRLQIENLVFIFFMDFNLLSFTFVFSESRGANYLSLSARRDQSKFSQELLLRRR